MTLDRILKSYKPHDTDPSFRQLLLVGEFKENNITRYDPWLESIYEESRTKPLRFVTYNTTTVTPNLSILSHVNSIKKKKQLN